MTAIRLCMVSQNPPENKIKANCLHFEPSINIVMIDLHPSTLKEIELIKQNLTRMWDEALF